MNAIPLKSSLLATAVASLLALGTLAGPAIAADATPAAAAATKAVVPAGPQVSVPFMSFGAVRDWRAISDSEILLQANNGKWYRATLFFPCPDLRFTERIGFRTKGTDTLDRFGSVIVSHRTYPLTSLVAAEAPAKRSKQAQPTAPAAAPAPAAQPATPPSPASPVDALT
jgi:hypothetical protein